MMFKIKKTETFVRIFSRATVLTVFFAMTALVPLSSAAKPVQKMFASPEEAVSAFVTAVRNNDDKEFVTIFGPHGKALFSSGDPVSDKNGREQFLKVYDEKNALVAQGEDTILEIGDQQWPFPIPLVKKGDAWFFDTVQGKEEILNRRIGRNELDSIQVCLAIVDAQREYAMNDHNADGVASYAEQFRSDAGQKNGLYWETKEGEAPSPMGPAVAKARKEGYSKDPKSDEPIPFHGYYYRILKAQGKNASGGAYDYVVNNKMIGGFAVVAYPAQYANSGVMTFMTNHDGVVYQKDLGKNTASIAKKMNTFDSDETWTKVEDQDQTEK